MYFLFALLAVLVVWVVVVFLRSRDANEPLVTATPKREEPDIIPRHPVVDPPKIPIDAPVDAPSLPINLIRQSLGQTPRKFSKAMRAYHHIDPPSWLENSDKDLQQIYKQQERIRRDGRIIWCAVVQANGNLFQPGPWDHGASVLWSLDPYFDANVDELLSIARECYALKGVDQTEADALRFSQMITNEMIRGMRLPAPAKLTGGREVFHSSLMVARKHLPSGHLTENIMPVWVDPNPTGILILVPAGYWPPSLTVAWKAGE